MKLDPCPFCGGEAEIERIGTHSVSTIYTCTICGCSLETGEEWDHGRTWNHRARRKGPWNEIIKPIADQFDLCAKMDMDHVEKPLGCAAISALFREMAQIIDEEIAKRPRESTGDQ